MIDIQNQQIVQSGHVEMIIRWAVVFMTPSGWFDDISDAIAFCAKHDLNSQFCVVPTVMAVSETMQEVK